MENKTARRAESLSMNGESGSARLDARPPMDISAERGFKSARVQDTLERVFRFSKLSTYSAKDRFLIRAADIVFFLLIRGIGGTVRWEISGWENWEAANQDLNVPIYVFWHNRVFLGTYFFRRRGIVVMTSQSFDGEYIARFIQRFGYGAARGSSTRGGTGAIVEMVRLIRAGCPAGFTIDGPKGPRYVAKMGAVLLAKKTGQPILPFNITPRHSLVVNSWDKLQIPYPFTKALVTIAPLIYVPSDADEKVLN